MSLGILGDAYRFKKNISDLVTQKERMAVAKDQNSSGLKYTRGRELGSKVVLVSSIQNEMKLLNGFMSQNQSVVKKRLDGEEAAIRNIQEVAIAFKESLVSFNDGNATKDPTSFILGFKQYLKTLEHEGNTKVGDSYIFGGTITNVPPFDTSKIADGLAPNAGVTLDYYMGNSTSVFMATDDKENLECDLQGNHPCFEKLIRAIKIASDPSISSGDARVTAAQDLADEAIRELAGRISQIGTKEAGLDKFIEAQEDRSLYLSDAYNTLVEANDVESATAFMADQVTLATAYAMMSRLGEMSLANYIK